MRGSEVASLPRGMLRVGLGIVMLATGVARGRAWADGPEAVRNTRDRVAALAERFEPGGPGIEADPRFGVLPGLLAALDIPLSSQALVFSKTSFQSRLIDPEHPRAVFFNEDTYVGWLPGSDLIEIATVDAEAGAVFYTLEPRGDGALGLFRDADQCIICHSSPRTQGVPGLLVRSVVTSPAGRFVVGAPTYATDDSSPFAERWGGWYVTGTHGSMRHMGNTTYPAQAFEAPFDMEAGANRLQLPEQVDATAYPTASSDIVALLVLEHQVLAQNLMTRARMEAQEAARLDVETGLPAGQSSEMARFRIAEAADRLLRCLCMADAISFASPVRGTSGFAAEYAARGPRDAQGRSFHQLDLDRRLFVHACSPLVHGEQFARLPETVRRHLGARLHDLLCTGREVAGFEHMDQPEREAIAAILAATEPEFWRTFVVSPRAVGP